jgi:transposase
MAKRGAYSPEFKRKAVALTRQPGVVCRQIALKNSIQPEHAPLEGRS